MNLTEAKEGEEYIIKEILTDDEELTSFLFSLGCYSGEPITVVSHLKGGCVVTIERPSMPSPAISSVAQTGSPEKSWL